MLITAWAIFNINNYNVMEDMFMSTVQAISDKRILKKAEKYLKRHHDEVYWLIWRIGIETGLRITDITKLGYDNINFESG